MDPECSISKELIHYYLLTIYSLLNTTHKALANAIRTSLGPRGMDKLMQLEDNSVLISNDGATILSKMNVLHPAAKMLVELSQAQDVQAGDGTTTVVVLAGALLDSASVLLRKGLHPSAVAQYFLQAAETACDSLQKVARPVVADNREQLLHAVETCLSSKVVSQNTDLLAPIAVDSVLSLLASDNHHHSRTVDLRDIRLVEQVGGTVDDTELIHGLVLTKGSAKSGGPKRMEQAKIALIQYCLSAPKTDMDNQVVVSDYAAMDRILREERKYLLEQCKQIKKTGCNVLLIQKSILRDAYNELSLHFLAKMGILVVTDIERSDVEFICRTLHCQPIAHPDQLDASKLGHAELVEDVYMEGGNNTVVQFTGIANAGSTVTVLLRGSNDLVLAEASRSLHDAQCVVRCLVQEPALMAGGGAAESQAAMALRQHARTLSGQDAYCLTAFADALEVIPYTLAENAGQNAIQTVTELRAQQAKGVVGAGIHVKTAQVEDMFAQNVVQPLMVTTSAIRLATETVAMILKIDDLIVVR
jgi:T-complex protein 1 subunit delta